VRGVVFSLVQWMQRAVNYSMEENRGDAGELAEMLRRIADCPKPVIARVQAEVGKLTAAFPVYGK
jgi:hypothetical protein